MRNDDGNLRVFEARGIETAEIRPINTTYRLLQVTGWVERSTLEREIGRFSSANCCAPLLLIRDLAQRWQISRGTRATVLTGPSEVEFSGAAAICAHLDRVDLDVLGQPEFQDRRNNRPSSVLIDWPETSRFALDVCTTRGCTSRAQHALQTLLIAARVPGVVQKLVLTEGELALIMPERGIFWRDSRVPKDDMDDLVLGFA
jgi:hypothetical protein